MTTQHAVETATPPHLPGHPAICRCRQPDHPVQLELVPSAESPCRAARLSHLAGRPQRPSLTDLSPTCAPNGAAAWHRNAETSQRVLTPSHYYYLLEM
eukprot:scaffold12474_cov129-Isochrysis_galbana.AAC.2